MLVTIGAQKSSSAIEGKPLLSHAKLLTQVSSDKNVIHRFVIWLCRQVVCQLFMLKWLVDY